MTWTHQNPLPDGHVLFFTDSIDHPDLIAIADGSGDTPEQTDDGVLWLDFSRPLMLGRKPNSMDYGNIPLLTPDSEQTTTITDVATVFLLSSWFNWDVNVRGILHKIHRSNSKAKVVPLAMVIDELDSAGMGDAANLIAGKFDK
jgi:hypothetical protein